MKNALLSILIHENKIIRRSTADCISSIITVELPVGQWQDLIPTLTKNTTNSNALYRSSATETLGFICEKLNKFKVTGLSLELLENMLTGICYGIKSDPIANQDQIKKSL